MKYSYKIKTTKGTTWIIPTCAALSLWHSRLTLPDTYNKKSMMLLFKQDGQRGGATIV